jgi:microcystin-dependent protein
VTDFPVITPNMYAATATSGASLAAGSIGLTGGSQPMSVLNPYLGLNYIIALQGVFPSRN